jgi:hypothetical protein
MARVPSVEKYPHFLQARVLLDPVVAIHRAGSRTVRPIPRIVVCVLGSKCRAQVMRRSRIGETNLAHDMATEGWMKLARAQ